MIEIALFGEDYAHQTVVGTLVERIARELGLDVEMHWISAVGGHGRVLRELRLYLRELEVSAGPYPSIIVIATDANCRGLNERTRELQDLVSATPLVLAIPDPHIERWLLLDGAAFRGIFGRGCDFPTYKCERDEYKRLLVHYIQESGTVPAIGGIEFAVDLVEAMDIDRAAQADPSLGRFVSDLRNVFRQFQL